MSKIVAFGDALIDFMPHGEPGVYKQNFGGAPANVCVAAARMGVSAAFCGTVGEDVFGRFCVDSLAANDVDVSGMKLTPEAITTLAFVTLAENGDRDFVFVRKPGADMFYHEADVDEARLKDAKAIHFCAGMLSCDATLKAMEKAIRVAKSVGALVSFDINYRAAYWSSKQAALETILRFLPQADILKFSEEEALWCSGKDSTEEAIQSFIGKNYMTIVTLGEKGAACVYDGEVLRADGFSVKAVDTTGAGDAFIGTLLSFMVEADEISGETLKGFMLKSNAAAALAVSKKGAISALPNRAELEAFLTSRG